MGLAADSDRGELNSECSDLKSSETKHEGPGGVYKPNQVGGRGRNVKQHPSSLSFGSHLGTLALKTENFSKKIGRFSKTLKWIY